ncbi:carbohydrate sulfotransferase 1-like [Oculina patagonica]
MIARTCRRRLRCFPSRFAARTALFVTLLLLYYMLYVIYLAISPKWNATIHGNLESFEQVAERKYFDKQISKRVLSEIIERKKRQSLIIVAHGRSGSSFTGNIFNYHPSVFYLFEPYQTVERLHGGVAPSNRDYQEKSFEWMQGVFQCKFVSPKHANDLHHYYRKVTKDYPRDEQASIALSSPPFCRYNVSDLKWNIQDCAGAFDQKTLEDVCKKKYSTTVVKALMTRMPNNSIEQLIDVCDSSNEFDCKLLFLVRDPRGIISSSQAVSFYRETDRTGLAETRKYSYHNCKQTELNLDIIRKLPMRWKKRIKILRYEDLAANPSKLLPGLLEFAGLPMDEAVSNWLYLASHKPETKSEQKAAKWRQDSSEGAQRWRWKVLPYEISIIENYCRHVMKMLGYKPLDLSYEMQRNLSISLLDKDFEALGWLN